MKPLGEWSKRELLTENDRLNQLRQTENHRHAMTIENLNEMLDAIEAELATRKAREQGALRPEQPE